MNMKRYFILAILSVGLSIPACAEEPTSYWLGDLNGDNKVTMADLSALIAVLNCKDDTEAKKYNMKAANVNEDSTVNLDDVKALADIILGKKATKLINENVENIPIDGTTTKFD